MSQEYRPCHARDEKQVAEFMRRLLARSNDTPEERDARRLDEIGKLRRAGVETIDDLREEHEIRRRQVERTFR